MHRKTRHPTFWGDVIGQLEEATAQSGFATSLNELSPHAAETVTLADCAVVSSRFSGPAVASTPREVPRIQGPLDALVGMSVALRGLIGHPNRAIAEDNRSHTRIGARRTGDVRLGDENALIEPPGRK